MYFNDRHPLESPEFVTARIVWSSTVLHNLNARRSAITYNERSTFYPGNLLNSFLVYPYNNTARILQCNSLRRLTTVITTLRLLFQSRSSKIVHLWRRTCPRNHGRRICDPNSIWQWACRRNYIQKSCESNSKQHPGVSHTCSNAVVISHLCLHSVRYIEESLWVTGQRIGTAIDEVCWNHS